MTVLALTCVAQAQGIGLADRPVAEVRIRGMVELPEQLIRNQIRLTQGTPYDPQVVEDDIVRITHLGRFSSVQAQVQPQANGAVVITYVVVEQPLISDIQISGNKAISQQDLLSLIKLQVGDPADKFLVDRALNQLKLAYEKAGYFATDVSYDKEQFKKSNVLKFHVREGPRVRVRQISFTGNTTFTAKQLRSKLQSDVYIPILRPGVLNRKQLDEDAARLREFYYDRGYLDAQVGRRIDLSPDQKDATVTFFIDQGRLYTVNDIRVEGNAIFSSPQIVEAMPLKVGDVFTAIQLQRSNQALIDLYGKLGFIETTIQIDRLFDEKRPTVDLLVNIKEGLPYLVGTVSIRGNQLTQDKVIYRQIRGLNPGRRFDRAGLEKTKTLLRGSSLFSDAKITILGKSDDAYRDVLIEVKEANTGSLSFGAGISSDAGVLGAVDLVQRNFDIADAPESLGEFFTGKAFRGAGQYFALTLQPGNELSRYSVSFREPFLLESNFSFDTNLFFFEREREDWDEQRTGATFGLGHRFGDVWSASVRLRAEEIDVSDIELDAPVDAFQVQGGSNISSIGIVVSRNTTDSPFFPTQGSRSKFELVRVGAFGGDFDFTRANIEFKKFWTVDEDFFGRRTVTSIRLELGYIFENNEAPIFERLYAGGHRSFRGFRFRGIGPRGIRADTLTIGEDPVGGDWLFLLGAEYNFPIYQDVVRGVLFVDSGTIEKDLGFDNYRVSVGMGVRLKIPFLGQAPFALDFAIPVAKEDGDETQVVSFDLALPF